MRLLIGLLVETYENLLFRVRQKMAKKISYPPKSVAKSMIFRKTLVENTPRMSLLRDNGSKILAN